MFLDDGEMAVVTAKGVTFMTFDGTPVKRTPTRVTWDPISAEKAGYKHFMLKEIFEQPSAVRETVLGRASLETGEIHLNEMAISDADLKAIDKITLLACGTSWHAALVGKFMIEELAKLSVEVDYGSEYRYRDPIIERQFARRRDHAVGRNSRHARRPSRGKREGRPEPAVCNVVGSMATREADRTIYTHAGRRSAWPRRRPSPRSWCFIFSR